MSSNITKKTLHIDNMTCAHCESKIEQELSKEAGVINVIASYSSGTATITYDESIISLKRIVEVIEKEDYHVKRHSDQEKTTKAGRKNSEVGSNAKSNNTRDYSNIIGIAVIVFALYMVAKRFGLINIFYNFPIAKDGMGYGMLFIIGLLTSIHCVAMCGGICLSQCVPKDTTQNTFTSKFSALRPSLLYNIGRVISYTIIGAIVGAIGSAVSFSGPMKGIVQILAGVFMVIMGINMLGIFPWLRKFNPRMPKIFAKKIYAQRNNNRGPLYIGLLNGLMPCGPLQAMQLYALSTGSPIKGAISMLIFSVGTVPLLFAFGAVSSLLSKKFTAKMMTVSAVLVVVLGVFMFNNGMNLSGLAIPSFTSAATTTKTATKATIKDGVQEVTTGVSSGKYEPIVVQKGIPVKWTIQAKAGDINGCNGTLVVQKYGIEKKLQVGDNVIEFTPTDSGTVPFSCWMGMIRSKIVVVDDLNNVDSSQIVDDSTQSTGGSCCAGGGGAGAGAGAGSGNSSSFSFDYSLLKGKSINTDKIAVATVKDNKQTVDITFDKKGFSPAVVVVQAGLETQWNINGKRVDSSTNTLMFPKYSAQLQVAEGANPISFVPDQDFDFFTSDGSFIGYVKVVDDINKIDKAVIKKEVSRFNPAETTLSENNNSL